MSMVSKEASLAGKRLTPKAAVEELIEDGSKIFALTPGELRARCQAYETTAKTLANRLLVMRMSERPVVGYVYDRTQKKAWEGFLAELSESEFLERMAGIALKCAQYDVLPFDEAEVVYEHERECLETRQRERDAYLARRQERVNGNSASTPAANERQMEMRETDVETGDAAAPSVKAASPTKNLYLPDIFSNQLQLPNVLLRCGVARIGAPNQERRTHKVDAPLRVTRVSGYAFNQLTVGYTGEELRTGDVEVWAQLLKFDLPVPLGERVVVRARDLLFALRRGTGGSAYRTLREEV